MARIRTVKPEFWASEQVSACSRDARLLFIGLWSFCDDAGIHPASYRRLKIEVFPGDLCSADDIKAWTNELIQNDLLIEYQIEDKLYWRVTGWQHQKIARPYYKYPREQEVLNHNNHVPSSEQAMNEQEVIDDDSVSSHISNHPVNINRDRNRKEIEDLSQVDNSILVKQIFEYWKLTLEHPRAKLDSKRASRIEKALELGYSFEEIKKAIDGCKLSAYHMGNNEQGKQFNDIELILRDAKHIEQFIGYTSNSGKPVSSSVSKILNFSNLAKEGIW